MTNRDYACKKWLRPSEEPTPGPVRIMDAFLFFVVAPLAGVGIVALLSLA